VCSGFTSESKSRWTVLSRLLRVYGEGDTERLRDWRLPFLNPRTAEPRR
jgi:hypothetical protein